VPGKALVVDKCIERLHPRNGGLFHDPACASSPRHHRPGWLSRINSAVRESKTSTYPSQRVSSILPFPSLPTFHFHPFRLKPSCVASHMEMALRPGSATPETYPRKTCGHPLYLQNSRRNQGKCQLTRSVYAAPESSSALCLHVWS